MAARSDLAAELLPTVAEARVVAMMRDGRISAAGNRDFGEFDGNRRAVRDNDPGIGSEFGCGCSFGGSMKDRNWVRAWLTEEAS